MTLPLVGQLTTAGFTQFVIGVRPQMDHALVLLHHPEGDRRFGMRSAFLDEETGLHITLNGEVPPGREEFRNYQEVESPHFGESWGKYRLFGEDPTRVMLGIYFSDALGNLKQAFDKVWVGACERFEAIHWEVSFSYLGLSAIDVSMALFLNVLERWGEQPGDRQHIYFTFKDLDLYNTGCRALVQTFGPDNVVAIEPGQLELFEGD